MNKHFVQVKKGGIVVVVKKLKTLFYLILQIPIYLISVPTVIIVHLIKPWFLIRWQELESSRIGHFAINTEFYCCERDAGINTPTQKYLDLFYLNKYVCNKQLEKMWRRSLIVLPTWLLRPLSIVNRFFCLFNSSFRECEIFSASVALALKTKKYKLHEVLRPLQNSDVHHLIDKFPAHISFTDKEELKGEEILKKFGLTKNAKFVCLIVRDSAYLNRHIKHEYLDERWQYHSYRDGDIDNYALAAEELAKRDYYVFRMGVKVEKPIKSSNPKIIDYANSGMRSDFMDIYLSAKCNFSISTGSGLDEVSVIFRKPIAFVGNVPFITIGKSHKETLVLTKHHINKITKKELTISEIFSANVAYALETEKYELNDVELKENSPKEIRDLIIEMDERLNGGWKNTNEDLLLQKRFWSIFEDGMKRLNFKASKQGVSHWSNPFGAEHYEKIKVRFGAKFLRENQNWIR